MPESLLVSPPAWRESIAERLRADWHARPDEGGIPLFSHSPEHAPVAAAVLVPLVARDQGPTVLLTQRTTHLHAHAGQISFPGGRVDVGDIDRIDTALRETEEETGVPRDRVEILGFLPDYDIMTGFRVTPVVGWVEPPFTLQPDPFEVAEVFEVPLAFFLEPANYLAQSRAVDGKLRHFYALPYEGRNIWGATAGMLRSLYRALTHQG